MYKSRYGQIVISENPLGFRGVRLDPKNRWIKLAGKEPNRKYITAMGATYRTG